MVGNKISDKIFSTVVSIISFILMAVCVVCIIINTKKNLNLVILDKMVNLPTKLQLQMVIKVLNKNGYNH